MADFQIVPMNAREREHFTPDAVELHRKPTSEGFSQVWPMTMEDAEKLHTVLGEFLTNG